MITDQGRRLAATNRNDPIEVRYCPDCDRTHLFTTTVEGSPDGAGGMAGSQTPPGAPSTAAARAQQPSRQDGAAGI